MSEKLKKCPLCGGQAILTVIPPHKHEIATWMPDSSGGAFVECTNCICTVAEDTIDRAIEVWNRRGTNEQH